MTVEYRVRTEVPAGPAYYHSEERRENYPAMAGRVIVNIEGE